MTTGGGVLRIGLYQGPARGGSVETNLAAIADAARRAADAGARLLLTPEMSVTGYNLGPRAAELAEPADGPIAERCREIAAQTGLALTYGYAERSGAGVHNTAAVVDRDGTLLAGYRKAHLYGDLDRGMFTPGADGPVQFDLDGVRVGMLICYDVEFPEIVRAHADAGTQLLAVPTALMKPYDVVATAVVPARAYESQLFVAYVNRCDVEDDLDYLGLSCLVGPDGSELVRAGADEELLISDVDVSAIERSRALNTHLADRRPELYGVRTSS